MPSATVNGKKGACGCDDDIVLTGISGRLPDSSSIEEFAKNLFEGVDLVTADDRRWQPGTYFFIFAFHVKSWYDFFDFVLLSNDTFIYLFLFQFYIVLNITSMHLQLFFI